MQLINYSNSILSIVPAAIALALAIATRRVLLSLGVGIIVGSFLLVGGNPVDALVHLKDMAISLTWADGDWSLGKPKILLFLVLLGIFTSLLTHSGSNQAFADWAKQHIKGRRGAKLLTACLVFVTFIDDYFHSLAVGAIARPVTDKFKVSRAKLAYILDSTAAPMCVLMPVSSWGAYIITLIAGLLATYSITGYSPIGAFMAMSAMNYYAIFSIIMVFFVAYFSFDIGAMAKHEKLALSAEEITETQSSEVKGHVRNLVLPILTLIIVTVSAMMYTGNEALAADGKPFSILGAFENTTVGVSLVTGGLSAVLVASLCIFADRLVNVPEYIKAWGVGIKSMSGAILILFFAWTINNVVSDVKTGAYLASLVSDTLPLALLPALLFILASVMAFSTGTSWGTFGIMLPIAAAIASHAMPGSVEFMLPCLSAVMAGAVCGDHCSPVSDTTILSSTGAKCDHMDHVTSQLPYALTVAIATIAGYVVVGFTYSGLLGFITTGAVLTLLVFIFKKR